MNLTIKIPETYTVLEKSYIEELRSEAWLLKHKKAGRESPCYRMMTTTKSFMSHSVHRRQTAQGWPIYWNIRCSAVLRSFL